MRWGGDRSRRFRLFILERDGYACLMLRDGSVCGRRATTVDHIVPRSQGGALYDPANARAACADCNYRAGGRLTGRARAPLILSPRQAHIVGTLDRLGLPYDAGRRHVLTVLTRMGRIDARQWRSDDIDAACAWRRDHPPATTAPPSRDW